jgi:hypothetical protein
MSYRLIQKLTVYHFLHLIILSKNVEATYSIGANFLTYDILLVHYCIIYNQIRNSGRIIVIYKSLHKKVAYNLSIITIHDSFLKDLACLCKGRK